MLSTRYGIKIQEDMTKALHVDMKVDLKKKEPNMKKRDFHTLHDLAAAALEELEWKVW